MSDDTAAGVTDDALREILAEEMEEVDDSLEAEAFGVALGEAALAAMRRVAALKVSPAPALDRNAVLEEASKEILANRGRTDDSFEDGYDDGLLTASAAVLTLQTKESP